MKHKSDIEKIAAQEKALVFETFSEKDAFDLGMLVVRSLEARGKGGLIDVTLWDRQVFAIQWRARWQTMPIGCAERSMS